MYFCEPLLYIYIYHWTRIQIISVFFPIVAGDKWQTDLVIKQALLYFTIHICDIYREQVRRLKDIHSFTVINQSGEYVANTRRIYL